MNDFAVFRAKIDAGGLDMFMNNESKLGLASICHEFAKEWGFYEKGRDIEFFTFRQLAHLAAEVGELSNSYRKTGKMDPEEAADIVIVLADLCGLHDIDLEAAIQAKIRKNRTRDKRFGITAKTESE